MIILNVKTKWVSVDNDPPEFLVFAIITDGKEITWGQYNRATKKWDRRNHPFDAHITNITHYIDPKNLLMTDEKVNNYLLQEQIAIKQNLDFHNKVVKIGKAFKDAGMESKIMIVHDDVNIIIDPSEVREATKIIADLELWKA